MVLLLGCSLLPLDLSDLGHEVANLVPVEFGDRGKAYFERAVSSDPKNPQGFENLGMFYLEARDPAKAAEVLELGSALPHASELLYSYLGDAYLTQQQPAKALQVAERGLGRNSAKCNAG